MGTVSRLEAEQPRLKVPIDEQSRSNGSSPSTYSLVLPRECPIVQVLLRANAATRVTG